MIGIDTLYRQDTILVGLISPSDAWVSTTSHYQANATRLRLMSGIRRL